jgi:O-antigen/teichoic acid export membrane protein
MGLDPRDARYTPVQTGRSALSSLRLLRNSTALRTTIGFGLGGVGYALGNLLLARVLPPAQFGVFTLFLALVQIGVTLAPIGLEGQVNRRQGAMVSAWRPLGTSLFVAATTVVVAAALYTMNIALLAALLISITAGGIGRVAAAYFQSQLRFSLALSLSQGLSLALVAMGAAAMITGAANSGYLAALVACYYVISAIVGWGLLTRRKPEGPIQAHSLVEGLSLLGITAAALILMQLERLMTPRLLTIEDLATFAVVATLVGSPFRMLQMGAGYTLLPRLSKASSQQARRQLVRREALAVTSMGSIAALMVWFAAPWIGEWLLAGKYEISASLMFAVLVSGAVKIADSFATTLVWALGSARQLAMLNWVSWASAAVGVGGAWLGAHWGLVGLVYGVSLGLITRGCISGALASRLLYTVPITTSIQSRPAAGTAS